MNSAVLLERVSKVALYALVALFPLWFLPITQNVLAYQKQALLVILVLLGTISWLARVVNQGTLQIRLSWAHVGAFGVLAAVGLSTLVSSWRYVSFWGWPLNIADSLVTVFSFALLYFFLTQTVEDIKHLSRILFMFLASGVIAGLYALLQAYGVHILPLGIGLSNTFNTIGSAKEVALFAAALLPLALVLAFVSKFMLRIMLWVAVAGLLLVLVMLNFKVAWLSLIAGLLLLLVFGMWNLRKRAEFGWVSLPMALVIVAAFFLMFQVRVPGAPSNLPIEISLSNSSTVDVAQSSMRDNFLLGSGPATFGLEYAKYRPAAINDSVFFATRFSTGASEALDWLVTKGILGLFALAMFAGLVIVSSVRFLVGSEQDSFPWMLGLGSLASFMVVASSALFIPLSLPAWFLFWLLAGSLMVLTSKTQKKLQVSSHPFIALGSSFAFLVLLIAGLGLLFVGGQKYAAEIRYYQGAVASSKGDTTGAISHLLSAAQSNPFMDLYWRDLSQLYLNQVQSISQNKDLSQEEKTKQMQASVSNAIATAKSATERAPKNVADWNTLGFVYRSLVGLPGAEGFAKDAYQKALELEPLSPFPPTETARTYVLLAQGFQGKQDKATDMAAALTTAEEYLTKALVLKKDYAPAHYLLAVVYDQQGKTKEAIATLEVTKQIPSVAKDIGLAFQLGVMYWREKDLPKAQAEFERAKGIDPAYSNARYMLGLVYDAQKNKDGAKAEFEAVAKVNPDNQEIKKILENLNKNFPALQGVNQEPPIQSAPQG